MYGFNSIVTAIVAARSLTAGILKQSEHCYRFIPVPSSDSAEPLTVVLEEFKHCTDHSAPFVSEQIFDLRATEAAGLPVSSKEPKALLDGAIPEESLAVGAPSFETASPFRDVLRIAVRF